MDRDTAVTMAQAAIKATADELIGEREAVSHMLG